MRQVRHLQIVNHAYMRVVVGLRGWWSVCGHCGGDIQMGLYGMRNHTYTCHPGLTVAGHPNYSLEPPAWMKKSSSSTPSKPDLRVVSSSTTDASPETSARTD